MKKLLLLLLLASAMGCKKDEPEPAAPINLVNTKWEAYAYTASGGEIYKTRLVFKSDTKVDFFTTYISAAYVTGQGVSELSYTISNPTGSVPKIRITGTLNSFIGEVGKGEVVDYTLDYYGDPKSLSLKYTQY